MNCDGVRGLLSAYVDGELSAGELLRVEQHLRRCHWCADEVDALRQTIQLVSSLEEVEVPAAFHVALHERLVAMGPPVQPFHTAAATRARRHDFLRWAVPAAAAAALVIGVAGLNRIAIPVPGTSPTAGLNTPAAPAANSTKPNLPGEVAQNPPESKGADPAQSTPSDQSGAGGQEVSTPPAPPPIESGGANGGETGAEPKPVVGPTNPTGIHTAGASYLNDVSLPTDTTQKQLGAALTVAVADPAGLAAELKSHFPAGAVNEMYDASSGIIKLQITLKASDFDAELAFVEGKTGVKADTFANDLSAQMAKAYAAISQLDLQRERIADSLEGETNATTIALANQQLAELARSAELAKADYQKLVDQSASGTIEVTLKPNQVR